MTSPDYSPEARRVRDKYRQELPDFATATAVASSAQPVPTAAVEQPVQTAAPAPAPVPRPAPPREAVWGAPRAEGRTETRTRTVETVREEVLSGRTEVAERGWQGRLNRALGTKLSKGSDELEYDNRVSQIQRKLRVPKRVAVLSGKGAAGKTSVALSLGSTIASKNRGMPVVALSIDPLGNLADRVRSVNSQSPRSVMSLAADPELHRAADVSSYLLTDKTGLRVLGSSTSDNSNFLDEQGLNRALEVLAEYHDLTVIDFGLNIDSPPYHAALRATDQLVLTTAITADSINELHTLIKTLRGFGVYDDLLQNAVVVFVQTRPGKTHIDVSASRDRFHTSYGMDVITVPFDEHIAEGGSMSLDLFDEDTRLSFVWLAAEVMSRLPVD